MNSKGSTWYTQSHTGTLLAMSLWAVTWGLDYEVAPLGHNSPHPCADLEQRMASNKLCADSCFLSQAGVYSYAEETGSATTAHTKGPLHLQGVTAPAGERP